MAFKYISYDRNQPLLLPPDIREWLPGDHLAWLIVDAVDQVNAGPLHARHPNNGPGRPAYDPVMLLALLVYSYCIGVRSSRQIERACHTDVAYRVIRANLTPDHSTIARLGADHEAAVAGGVHRRADAVRPGGGRARSASSPSTVIKMAGAASRKANRTLAQLRTDIAAEVEAILAQAAELDAAEDRLWGPDRGDELPAALADRSDRLARLSAAARLPDARAAEAAAQAEAATAQRAAKQTQAAADGHKIPGQRPKGQAGVAAAEADLAVERAKAAQRKADRTGRQAAAEAAGRKLKGRAPDCDRPVRAAEKRLAAAQAAAAAAEAEAAEKAKPDRANTTDPDSRGDETLGRTGLDPGLQRPGGQQRRPDRAHRLCHAGRLRQRAAAARGQSVPTATGRGRHRRADRGGVGRRRLLEPGQRHRPGHARPADRDHQRLEAA